MQKYGARLISIDAPLDVRYERVRVLSSHAPIFLQCASRVCCAHRRHSPFVACSVASFGLTTKTRTCGHRFGTTQVVGRGSETDKVSKEKFRADEEREWANTDPNKQNLKAVMEMADIKLDNTSTLADLHKTLDVIF